MRRSSKNRCLLVLALTLASMPALAQTFDVVVYGGTASGVIAAVSAAREGAKVALVNQNGHIGGMVSNGLFHTDTGRSTVIGGIAKEFWTRGDAYYAAHPIQRTSSWFIEPHVAEILFGQMLNEAHVSVLINARLKEKGGVEKHGKRITSIVTEDGRHISGKVFIDASYEGDLMAFSGVSYTYGREAQSLYKEYSAGVRAGHSEGVNAVDDMGHLLFGVEPAREGQEGDGDKKTQAYNFRVTVTKDPAIRVPFPKPDGYDPRFYDVLARQIQAAESRSGADETARHIMAEQVVAAGKGDSNLADFIGASWGYPDGTYAERTRIFKAHVTYTMGWYWFLQNDPRLSETFRKAVAVWGLAKDEFIDNNNWPRELYVREARRMVSDYVMTQPDVVDQLEKTDVIALGSYGLDVHPVQRYRDDKGKVAVEGAPQRTEEARMKHIPYAIPYRVLVPKNTEVQNLLVSTCPSVTHVVFATVRMEPQFMMMGQAAGTAAAMAAAQNKTVQSVDIAVLQSELRKAHAILDWKGKDTEDAP